MMLDTNDIHEYLDNNYIGGTLEYYAALSAATSFKSAMHHANEHTYHDINDYHVYMDTWINAMKELIRKYEAPCEHNYDQITMLPLKNEIFCNKCRRKLNLKHWMESQ